MAGIGDRHESESVIGIVGIRTWLRQQGVPAEIIGQGIMGHRDGRMMERVYGRMTSHTAGTLIAQHLGEKKWVQLGALSRIQCTRRTALTNSTA